MATVGYPTRAYQSTEAATADPRHTVVLLFDALARYLHQAGQALARGDHYEHCQGVVRAQKILSALGGALDPSADARLAGDLGALYQWLHAKLSKASVDEDQELLGEVTGIVNGLREAWRQAEANVAGHTSPPAPSPRADASVRVERGSTAPL